MKRRTAVRSEGVSVDVQRMRRRRNRALVAGLLLFVSAIPLRAWMPGTPLVAAWVVAAGSCFAIAGVAARTLRRAAADGRPPARWLPQPLPRPPASNGPASNGRGEGSFAVEVLVGIERAPHGLPLHRVGDEAAAPDGRRRPGWVAVRCERGEAAAYGVPLRTLPFTDHPTLEELPEEHVRAAFARAREGRLPNAPEPRLYLALRGVN